MTRASLPAGRPQMAPAVYAAVLSMVCIAVLLLRGRGAFFPPLITFGDSHIASSVGGCLARLLAMAQTVAVAAWAPWIGARAARRAPAALGHGGLELALFLLASLPIATAAWLAGGWDLNAMLGLYLTNGILGAALAAAGAAATPLAVRRSRIGLLGLSAVCLLTLASARITSDPLLKRADADATLAFVSPGYGLTLFFRGAEPFTPPPRSRDWLKHFAALAAWGSLAGTVAWRAQSRAGSRPAR
jgi:hypothetical protein